jgi:predicted RND superfamily exporter protein
LLAVFVLLALAIGGIAHVRISHNPLHWLPEESQFRRANELLDEEFGGGYQLELLVHMREGRSLREPEVLQAMRNLADDLSGSGMPHLRASKVVGLHA